MTRPPLAALVLASAPVAVAEELPDAKPVPLVQALPLPEDGVSIERGGEERTRFYAGHAPHRRAFWYPLRARAGGPSLTRMGHPHDPVSHSHHNSVWVSHHDLDGVDFWGDRGEGKGRIEFVKTARLWDGDDRAGAETHHAWSDSSGAVLLRETRRWEWVELGAGRGAILQIEIEAAPAEGRATATFGETAFGLIGVRMAKTIGVHDGGGRILNSEGARGEEAIFRKPARWVDYSGPLGDDGAAAGITLMDHPSNPRHPAPFHVRGDGWMGACLSFAGAVEVTGDAPLRVRYGLWVHEGAASREQCDAAWATFSELAAPGER